MLFLKVPKKRAELVRKELISKSLFEAKGEVFSENGFVFFPLKEQSLGYSDIVEKMGEVVQRDRPLAAENPCKEKVKLPPMDVIGSIAILECSKEEALKASRWILQCNKSIKSVFIKKSAMKGEYRVRDLEHVAGDPSTETIHKENGIRMLLDVEKVFFSPRLSTERARVASLVKSGENVAVLFAGVGPFSLLIGKKCPSCSVISVELNPIAHSYAVKNIKLNKLDNVVAINADVRELLKDPKWESWADRVVMPLPKDVINFLDVAEYLARENSILHVYVFASSESEAKDLVCSHLSRRCSVLNAKECGSYSKEISRWVVDVKLL